MQDGVVTFDPEGHTYTYHSPVDWHESHLLASVTTVMKDVGISQNFDDLPSHIDLDWYGDRGTKIHKACHLWDEGTLDESTVDEEIVGFLDSYKEGKGIMGFDVIKSEEIVFDPILQFAGMLDKLVYGLGGTQFALIDLKSGQPHPSHGIQLAGYWLGLKSSHQEWLAERDIRDRHISLFGLYLRADGSLPKLYNYTDVLKINVSSFRGALTTYYTKRRIHGYN